MERNLVMFFRRPLFSARASRIQNQKKKTEQKQTSVVVCFFCHGADAARPLCCLRAHRGLPGLAAVPGVAMRPAQCIAPLSPSQTSQAGETGGRDGCPANCTELAARRPRPVEIAAGKNLLLPNCSHSPSSGPDRTQSGDKVRRNSWRSRVAQRRRRRTPRPCLCHPRKLSRKHRLWPGLGNPARPRAELSTLQNPPLDAHRPRPSPPHRKHPAGLRPTRLRSVLALPSTVDRSDPPASGSHRLRPRKRHRKSPVKTDAEPEEHQTKATATAPACAKKERFEGRAKILGMCKDIYIYIYIHMYTYVCVYTCVFRPDRSKSI